MLTARIYNNDGSEIITEVGNVKFVPEKGEEKEQLVLLVAEGVTLNVRYARVFIMNDSGNTIADYKV